MKKNDKSVISIIGGADGPTSIFIAGRTGKRPLKVRIKNWIYCQKRRRIAVKIRPNPHTLKQVTAFMKMEYGAAEVSKESRQYQERKASLREGLIIQNRPELLEGLEEMKRPEVFTKEAMEEMSLRIKRRSEAIARIPDEQFTMDFHVYEIIIEGGRMEIEVDYLWDILGISYSGNKRAMRELKKMGRRLYVYYGVTKEDIRDETKRYSFLVTALASWD
ncbi:MAG: sodium ion-translocating decarboxylase subunit beta [Clostridia bacterium]|nr:sodium ion-translocating decarboxylase subunit beta [Clostridia bacterium]